MGIHGCSSPRGCPILNYRFRTVLGEYPGGVNRPLNVITARFFESSLNAAEVHPSTVLQDERKKQPATMLRSSWAFKHSPFFAPDHETSTRPLRRLAVYPPKIGCRKLTTTTPLWATITIDVFNCLRIIRHL